MILSSSNSTRQAKQSFQQLAIRNAYFGAFASPLTPFFIPVETGAYTATSQDSPFPHSHYSIDGLNVLRRLGKEKLRLAILLTLCLELLRHGRQITIYFDSHTERLFRKFRPQEVVFFRRLIADFGNWFKVSPREADADTHVLGDAERRSGIFVSEDSFTNPAWYAVRFPFITDQSRRLRLRCYANTLRIGSHVVPFCRNVPRLMREIAAFLRCPTGSRPMAA